MSAKESLFVLLVLLLNLVSSQDLSKVGFVIMSQPNKRHAEIAEETRIKLMEGLSSHGVKDPTVYMAHKDLPRLGAWTYFPLFPVLLEKSVHRIKWFVFVEENAEINFNIFKQIISNYSPHYETFIGHEMTDAKPSIVHRFIKHKIGFPDIVAGFILSRNLVAALADKLEEVKQQTSFGNIFVKEYSMDAAYELSQAIRSLDSDSGPRLDHEPLLCTKFSPGCAIYPRETKYKTSEQDVIQLVKQTLFAVKTCSQFHDARLPILKDTWAPASRHVVYISEQEDKEHGTITLPDAGFNTPLGHCRKTEAILEYFAKHQQQNHWSWLVILDDDTLLSVAKLMDLVKCYESDDEMVALGQIYGFRVIRPKGQAKFDYLTEGSKNGGYDYLAGGGGMVFNKNLVLKMLSHDRCKCPSPSHHDDIHLGYCLDYLGVPIIRNERFHQARPEDYNTTLIQRQDPISFHKFIDTDPRGIYNDWFRESDQFLLQSVNQHREL